MKCTDYSTAVSSVSAERSFSALKQVKTYLCNTQGRDRLSSLALFSIGKALLARSTVAFILFIMTWLISLQAKFKGLRFTTKKYGKREASSIYNIINFILTVWRILQLKYQTTSLNNKCKPNKEKNSFFFEFILNVLEYYNSRVQYNCNDINKYH